MLWTLCVVFSWRGVATVAGGSKDEPAGGRFRRSSSVTSPARQLAESYDAGDSYAIPGGRRVLRRLGDAVAVSGDAEYVSGLLATLGKPLAEYRLYTRLAKDTVVIRRFGRTLQGGVNDAAAGEAVVAGLKADPRVTAVSPVFVDPKSGVLLVLTGEVLVRLKPGADTAEYFRADRPQARPLAGTTDQFRLTLATQDPQEVFQEVDRRAADPRVSWVEPNFLRQVVKRWTPNDPLFGNQWHLQNTGQSGILPDADLKAVPAWDLSRGSSNVVIAFFDDGVDLSHPDLRANIFQNTGELRNGRDDDGNGYVDDLNGWNFEAHNNNPSPSLGDDAHGTLCAGVAAAVGNNGIGVTGVAPACRILPIKYGATTADDAAAVYYMAGRAANGRDRWRGADILSFSVSFGESLAVSDALNWAATQGRGGRGCAIFAAAGNDAARWQNWAWDIPAGTHTFTWSYQKDWSISDGADTVWLDSVVFPGGQIERFEASRLPSGWRTGGYANWSVVQDEVGGNHALTGWGGPGSRAARAGAIGDDQYTYLEVTKYVPAGTLSFWVWVSSEYSDFDWLDYLSFSLDGEEQFRVDDPVLDVQLEIDGFPANHADVMAVGASTDLGYRSDYSQYGAKLDFVTLSSGGLLGIPSTDLTGLAGESSDDYLLDFGGTSASVPMAAGVAALVLAANPELRPTQLRTLLRLSAEKIGGVQYTSGFSPYYGYGRLNARKAIELAIPPRLVNPRLAGGVLSVSVASVSGYRYTLQYKGGVEAASWSSLPAVAGNDSVLTLTDPGAAGQPRRFYRVLASP